MGDIGGSIGRESWVVLGVMKALSVKLDALNHEFAVVEMRSKCKRRKWRLARRKRVAA